MLLIVGLIHLLSFLGVDNLKEFQTGLGLSLDVICFLRDLLSFLLALLFFLLFVLESFTEDVDVFSLLHKTLNQFIVLEHLIFRLVDHVLKR